VTGIDISEPAAAGIELSEEEGGVAIFGRSFIDQVVDFTHQGGEISIAVAGEAVEGSAQAGHQQRRRDAFAGNIADRYAE
jgi:hypothetical protein